MLIPILSLLQPAAAAAHCATNGDGGFSWLMPHQICMTLSCTFEAVTWMHIFASCFPQGRPHLAIWRIHSELYFQRHFFFHLGLLPVEPGYVCLRMPCWYDRSPTIIIVIIMVISIIICTSIRIISISIMTLTIITILISSISLLLWSLWLLQVADGCMPLEATANDGVILASPREKAVGLAGYVYVYMYMCVYIYIYIYVYKYLHIL